jgi:hypothetical protein
MSDADYEAAYRAWRKEMHARIADCASGINMARAVTKANKVQIGCLRRIMAEAERDRRRGARAGVSRG